MTVKNLKELLYKGEPELIKLTEGEYAVRSIGEEGASLSPIRAELPVQPKTKKAKMSVIAKILDMCFFFGNMQAYIADKNIIFVKFSMGDKDYSVQVSKRGSDDGINILWNCPGPIGKMIFVPLLAYAATENAEIMEEIQLLKTAIVKKEQSEINNLIFQICDSFYYKYAKDDTFEKSINQETEAIEDDFVQQMIDAGLCHPIALFSLSDMPTPKVTAQKNEESEFDPEKYKVEYDGWTDEQKLKIPHNSNYVMTPTAEKIIKKIKFRMDRVLNRMNKGATGVDAIENDYVNIQLVGRPASGKTKLAYAVGEYVGMPVYTVPFTKNTEEDTVEGRNKVVKGKIDFVETDFLKAYQNGGIVILEEINLADPAVVMGSLGQAIEFPFIVMKDGYTPVRRHPLCIIVATMNTGTTGSKSLNEAFSTRLKQTYVLEDPKRDLFLQILKSKGFKAKAANWVYRAYTSILNALKNSNDDLAENITLRACLGALENIEEGSDPKEAIRDTMIGKIAEKDLEVAKKIDKEVLEALPERI